jgi:hypothetical protein
MKVNRLLVIAAALLTMSDCALAMIYKCNGVYQDAPCSADRDEGRVRRTATGTIVDGGGHRDDAQEKAATPTVAAPPAPPTIPGSRKQPMRPN